MGRRVRPPRAGLRGGRPLLKLLDVTEFYSPSGGGVRTYLDAKGRHLAGHDDIEHVLILSGDRDATLDGPPRVHLVRGPPVPGSPGYHAMLRARRVRRLIREERPDVIELGSHFLAPWVVGGLARELGAALVGFYHTDVRGVLGHHGLRRAPGRLARAGDRVLTRYLRAVYGRCDLVIAATDRAARSIHDACRVPVEVVPLGVDTTLFHPSKRSDAVRAGLSAAPHTPLLLYAGRLSREKELETVLAALPALHAACGARWIVVGEGHLRARLEAFAARHSHLLMVLPFERDRERLAALYASCDAYVAPGPYETFGLAAHEALASGLPVIGVDAGAMGELMRDDPRARLYRQRDPQDFTRAALALRAEPRAPFAAHPQGPTSRAQRRAAGRSWVETVARLADLYRSLASRSSRSRSSSSTSP